MTTLSVVVLVLAAIGTVLTLAVVGVRLWRRVRRAVAEAVASYEQVLPALERLQGAAEVTRRELDRVQATWDGTPDRGAGPAAAPPDRRAATREMPTAPPLTGPAR